MRRFFTNLLPFGSPPDPPPPLEDLFRSADLNQLTLPNETPQEFTAAALEELNFISKGGYGRVFRMKHRKSGKIMAVKKVRVMINMHNDAETQTTVKRLKTEIKAIRTGSTCPYIVQFYGALMSEGDCWICMELMSGSLYQLYKNVYEKKEIVPEDIIGFTTVAVLGALTHLKNTSNIMHRDLKPENILLNMKGNIKLCDFGISGVLINSLAMSHVGTAAYLAPERLDVPADTPYDVRSDVWGLGITLIEVAQGKFPYDLGEKPKIFAVQAKIKADPAPRMPDENAYTANFNRFLGLCLQKNVNDRPKYAPLMEEPFYAAYAQRQDALKIVADIVERIL